MMSTAPIANLPRHDWGPDESKHLLCSALPLICRMAYCRYIHSLADFATVGDKMYVRVNGLNDQGRLSLCFVAREQDRPRGPNRRERRMMGMGDQGGDVGERYIETRILASESCFLFDFPYVSRHEIRGRCFTVVDKPKTLPLGPCAELAMRCYSSEARVCEILHVGASLLGVKVFASR